MRFHTRVLYDSSFLALGLNFTSRLTLTVSRSVSKKMYLLDIKKMEDPDPEICSI